MKNAAYNIKSLNLANELRQSSDDLTRMARSYVVTGNKRYKQNFYKILAIRNGLVARPNYYPATYWYLSNNLNQATTKAVPLKSIMKNMGFTKQEFELLNKAQNRSDKLALIEEKAFAILDANALNTEPNSSRLLATNLLFSAQYQNEKIAIMQPIQQFIALVEQRILDENEKIHQQKQTNLVLNLAFILLTLVLGSLIAYYLKKYVLNPVLKLADETDSITAGHYDYQTDIHITNEVGQLAQCIERMAHTIEENNQKLTQIAVTDELTGISNRRYFFDVLGREMQRANRHQRNLSILMMDIDYFKKFNDKHGHLVGDEVLKHVCKLCLSELRVNDLIGRIGGEEFDILLPETSIVEAEQIAQRMRQIIESSSLSWQDKTLSVTVSIGVTTMKPNEKADTLLSRVDSAMYKAKQNGRNQVSVAGN